LTDKETFRVGRMVLFQMVGLVDNLTEGATSRKALEHIRGSKKGRLLVGEALYIMHSPILAIPDSVDKKVWRRDRLCEQHQFAISQLYKKRAPPQQTYDRNLLKKDIRANKFNIIWQVRSVFAVCRDMVELARAVEGAESVGW
jgi:hypothetical protein